MRVFVAGASGAMGRPLVRELLAAGHEVTGTTRFEERAETIRAGGARAAVCDALDAEALARAVAEARPEVVVHALTALPDVIEPRANGRSAGGDEPAADRGHPQPDRGRAGGGRAAADRRERRLPLRAERRLGQGRGRGPRHRRAGAIRPRGGRPERARADRSSAPMGSTGSSSAAAGSMGRGPASPPTAARRMRSAAAASRSSAGGPGSSPSSTSTTSPPRPSPRSRPRRPGSSTSSTTTPSSSASGCRSTPRRSGRRSRGTSRSGWRS